MNILTLEAKVRTEYGSLRGYGGVNVRRGSSEIIGHVWGVEAAVKIWRIILAAELSGQHDDVMEKYVKEKGKYDLTVGMRYNY